MSSAEPVHAETPDLKVKKKKTKVDSGKKKDPLKKKRKAEAAVKSEAGSPEVSCRRPKHAQELPRFYHMSLLPRRGSGARGMDLHIAGVPCPCTCHCAARPQGHGTMLRVRR
jgi:hypothetical protein